MYRKSGIHVYSWNMYGWVELYVLDFLVKLNSEEE